MNRRIFHVAILIWLLGVCGAAGVEGNRARTRSIQGVKSSQPSEIKLTGNTDTLCSSTFEDGKLPAEWTFVNTAPPNDTFPENWFVTTTDDSIAIGNGYYLCWVNYSETNIQDEWIKTPIMNLSQYTDEIYLDFVRIYHAPDPWADSATVYVRVSLDGGSTWPDTVYSISRFDNPGRKDISLRLDELVPECAGNETVGIGFQYAGKNGDSAGLDDISVSAVPPDTVKIQNSSWGAIKASFR